MNWKALQGVARGCRALRFSGFSGFSGFKVPIESRRRHFKATHTRSCPATRPHRRGSLLADVGAVGADDEIIALLGLFCIRCFRNFRARLLALFSPGQRLFALLFPLRLRSHLSSVSASVSASPSSILCIFATATATATCHHDGRSRRPFPYHLRPGCPSQVVGFHPHRIWLPALPLWPFDPARGRSFHAF